MGSRRGTVLLVDDDPVVRALLRRALEAGGFQVLEAGCAEEALELAAGHRGSIGVMVTDIEMPGTRGPELARRLALSRPETAVIYITGNPGTVSQEPGSAARGAGSGSPEPDRAETLVKPFRTALLLQKVQELMR